jgi:hypothetical protein
MSDIDAALPSAQTAAWPMMPGQRRQTEDRSPPLSALEGLPDDEGDVHVNLAAPREDPPSPEHQPGRAADIASPAQQSTGSLSWLAPTRVRAVRPARTAPDRVINNIGEHPGQHQGHGRYA